MQKEKKSRHGSKNQLKVDHRHKCKTIELVENNGKNLYDFEFSNDFLHTITKTLSMTEKNLIS